MWWSRGWGALALAAGVSGCAAGLGDPLEREAFAAQTGRCFVAFVHGRGDDRRGASQSELEHY